MNARVTIEVTDESGQNGVLGTRVVPLRDCLSIYQAADILAEGGCAAIADVDETRHQTQEPLTSAE